MNLIYKLYSIIYKRISNKNKSSYSYYLSNNSNYVKRKIMEECFEYVMELKERKSDINKKRLLDEFCDVLYHLIVSLVSYNIDYFEIVKHLSRR